MRTINGDNKWWQQMLTKNGNNKYKKQLSKYHLKAVSQTMNLQNRTNRKTINKHKELLPERSQNTPKTLPKRSQNPTKIAPKLKNWKSLKNI